MISETIKLLQSKKYYKLGTVVEISKGSYESYSIKNILTKIKRKIKNTL